MRIGHVNLAASMNGIGEHFIRLIAALCRQRVEQHVLVADPSLANRLAACKTVAVGPLVTSPVMAYCLLPTVDVVHAHDTNGGRAGLLMALTRSTPYVLNCRSEKPVGRNPIVRSTFGRAASLVCDSETAAQALFDDGFAGPIDVVADIPCNTQDDQVVANRIAAEHLRIYRRAVDSWRVPALLL